MVEELKDILVIIDAAQVEIFGDSFCCSMYINNIEFDEDNEEFSLSSAVNLNLFSLKNKVIESWEWSGNNLFINATFGSVNFENIIFKGTLDKIDI